ncbi:MAG TPA: FHA domain-containing protein [Gemmatimonadales bacterium]|nr:FHA domain-containing protein [Gemmatimonadales bacterium]
MMHLDVGGRRVPIAAGETIIGSAPGNAIVLEGEGVLPRHAVVNGTPQGAAAIRSAAPGAELLINGVRLGTDPTPVLHGDKIQIAGHELLVVDPRRSGHTQLFDSGAFADLAPPPPAAKPPSSATGGRLVCLTDGREYTVSTEPLVFGRDAVADVVVAGNDVSRRHAEIQTSPEGYVLVDLSVNGSFVNGQRIGRSQLLARADVIRIGHDEFRFYADAAPAAAPRSRPTPTERGAVQAPTGAGHQLSDTMHGLPVSELRGAATPPSAEAAPIASLLVRSGAFRGKRMPIRAPVVNIGRADYNDVVISEPSVSTTHAKLQRRDDVWVLSDLGSTNGTYVEGEPVTGETALTPGTTLRFGEVAVLFEPFDEQPAAKLPDTQVLERMAPDEVVAPAEMAPAPRVPRRPIRAAVPRPSGPPVWLIVVLLLVVAAVAWFLLTSS